VAECPLKSLVGSRAFTERVSDEPEELPRACETELISKPSAGSGGSLCLRGHLVNLGSGPEFQPQAGNDRAPQGELVAAGPGPIDRLL